MRKLLLAATLLGGLPTLAYAQAGGASVTSWAGLRGVIATGTAANATALTGASVTKRGPSASDDSTKGYAVGNLWNVPGLGMWIAADVTPGAALWTSVQTGILPCDSIPSGAILVCYGTRLMRAAYAGKAMNVTTGTTYSFTGTTISYNWGSTTTDIGFRSDGSLDVKALGAAIGPVPALSVVAGPQMWSAFVNTWYDQKSGTALNATATVTGGGAPSISPVFANSGNPYIGFASGGLNWASYNNDGTLNTAMQPRLAIGTGLSWNNQNLSTTVAMRGGPSGADQVGGGGVNDVIAYNASFPYYVISVDGNWASTPVQGGAGALEGTEQVFGWFIPDTPSIYAQNAGASSLTAYDDDNSTYSGAALSAVTGTGALIGGATTSANGYGMGLDALVSTTLLTPAQSLALREALTDTFHYTPQVRNRVVLVGDSRSAGAEGWMAQSELRQAESQFIVPQLVYNIGVGGSTVGGASGTSRLLGFAKQDATLYSQYGTCVFYNEGGINDLGAGTSGATLIGYLNTWNTQVKALGPNVKTINQTLEPIPEVLDATRLPYNALVLANSQHADAISDMGNTPFLNLYSDLTNLIVFSGDGHIKPYGEAIGANVYARIINAMTAGE